MIALINIGFKRVLLKINNEYTVQPDEPPAISEPLTSNSAPITSNTYPVNT